MDVVGKRGRTGRFSAQDIAAAWGQDLGQNWAGGTNSGEERLEQEAVAGTGTVQSPGCPGHLHIHLQPGDLS